MVSDIRAFRYGSKRLSRKNKSFLDNLLCSVCVQLLILPDKYVSSSIGHLEMHTP